MRLNKYKKTLYKNVKSCKPTKNIKRKENFKNVKKNIFENKEITIVELIGFNYYNPKLININQLLKMPQIQHKSKVNITNLLLNEERRNFICD